MNMGVFNQISYMDNRENSLIRDYVNDLSLSKADFRVIEFLCTASKPITEDQIILYYKKNVQRYLDREEAVFNPKIKGYEYKIKPVTDPYKKILAMAWFDRGLGRILRKNILNDEGRKLIN